MRPALAVLLALSLAGCARWVKLDATTAELQRDQYECERDMRAVSSSFWFTGWGFYKRCMEAHGWHDASNWYGAIDAPPPLYTREPAESTTRPGPTTPQCEWGRYWDSESARCQRIPE